MKFLFFLFSRFYVYSTFVIYFTSNTDLCALYNLITYGLYYIIEKKTDHARTYTANQMKTGSISNTSYQSDEYFYFKNKICILLHVKKIQSNISY